MALIEGQIPGTNATLPAIGLGTWQSFDVGPSPVQRAPLAEVISLLVQHGATVIDSSPMYGKAEAVVGELLEESGLSPRVFLATKVWTTGKEEGLRQINNSFHLLKTDMLDLLQIHNLVDWRVHLKTLRDMKERGRIKYIGITHYHESAYQEIEKILKTEKIDFLQINYSVDSRKADATLLPLAMDKRVAVVINQPFGAGKLFSRVKGKILPGFAKEIGCHSWSQLFLKFILTHPAVTCIIPGTSSPGHLLENLQAGIEKLPDAKFIRKIIESIEN